ncbi:MAG: hypothetical protein UHS49_04095 [Faecalimonas sp.]|nr:hypothetical protein [Faecalimonas sp.]
MVRGLELFRKYFADYTEQYVLIGGAACDICFNANESAFRATKDFDMVLIVEAQTKEFGQKFWEFIHDGKYSNRAKSNGRPQFYRFDKPQEPDYPVMIELFARTNQILDSDEILTPVHMDDTVSSLSAILLDAAYYETLLAGRTVIEGVSVLRPEWLVPFKAKAWLDLQKRIEAGEKIDSRNLKKHKNDILRIVAEFVLESCELSETVKADMQEFCKKLDVQDAELKSLKMSGIHEADIKKRLADTYGL